MQGVERLYGALSAHMWPGMVLKSGNRIYIPSMVNKEGKFNGNSSLFANLHLLRNNTITGASGLNAK